MEFSLELHTQKNNKNMMLHKILPTKELKLSTLTSKNLSRKQRRY